MSDPHDPAKPPASAGGEDGSEREAVPGPGAGAEGARARTGPRAADAAPGQGAPAGSDPGRGDPPSPADDAQATVQLSPEEIAQLQEASYPSDPDDPLVGTLLRNKWRVLGRIGSGSFGTVYKVKDVNGEWIEALKILSVDRLRGPDGEKMRARFLREAQIMKRLGQLSPHIVGLSTYEDDIEAGLIYFLMEHVEGRMLSEVLLEEGPLGVERTIRIGLQVCDALIAAHESEEPVVHRDLKLENLMLTKDRDGEEFVKVLDFGIAKIAEREGDSRLTATGTLGTPGYAAPEQLRAETIDGRTDLFAFGVILYSLVTGRNPWLGHLAYQPTNQTYELMAASDRAEVIPIAKTGVDVPEGLVDIIMKLLQREPEDRFQSARALRDALLTLIGHRSTGTGRLNLTRELAARTSPSEPERRLAAVWFADLVGYSTLSSQDEEAALTLLDTFHKTARRVIEAGGGRVVQFIGDAVFAEFSSTQRAVVTARDFQEAFTEGTAESPFTPQLRIGVHVGDVLMAADGDVFGDGVNVAARIQNEAEPGQILVSQDVWRQLKQRRDFGFVAIGERTLKGIGQPVALFAVVEAGEVATTGDLARDPTTGLPTYDGTVQHGAQPGRGRKLAAVAVIALVAVGGGAYALFAMGGGATDQAANPADPPPTNPVPTPALPDTVSVAGGDPAGPAPGGGAEEPEPEPVQPPPDPVPTGGGDEVAPPGDPPPSQPVEDPNRSRYEQLRGALVTNQQQARSEVHDGARQRLGEAESLWSEAGRHAGAGRYSDALDAVQAAGSIYAEVVTTSAALRRVDAARATVGRLRPAATDPGLVAEAARLERDADAAVAQGRHDEAVRLLGLAADRLEAAARAPDSEPEPEPVIVPQSVATEVLTRLKAAMEARDLDRVRAVWTSVTPEEADGFRQTFDRMSALTFNYQVREARLQGSAVVTVVQITYEFPGVSDPVPAPTQRFVMEQRASGWVIVASNVEG